MQHALQLFFVYFDKLYFEPGSDIDHNKYTYSNLS